MYNRCDENVKPSEEYKDEILNLNRFHNEVSLYVKPAQTEY